MTDTFQNSIWLALSVESARGQNGMYFDRRFDKNSSTVDTLTTRFAFPWRARAGSGGQRAHCMQAIWKRYGSRPRAAGTECNETEILTKHIKH